MKVQAPGRPRLLALGQDLFEIMRPKFWKSIKRVSLNSTPTLQYTLTHQITFTNFLYIARIVPMTCFQPSKGFYIIDLIFDWVFRCKIDKRNDGGKQKNESKQIWNIDNIDEQFFRVSWLQCFSWRSHNSLIPLDPRKLGVDQEVDVGFPYVYQCSFQDSELFWRLAI